MIAKVWPDLNHDRAANGVIDFPTILSVQQRGHGADDAAGQTQPLLAMAGENRGSTPCLTPIYPVRGRGKLKSRKTVHQPAIEPGHRLLRSGFSLTPLKFASAARDARANDGKAWSAPHPPVVLRSGGIALAGAAGPGEGIQLLDPPFTRQ